MSIVIVGFTEDDKVPGAVGETKYGQGLLNTGGLPVTCLVVGNMTSGTATPDLTVSGVTDEDDAAAKFGAHSEVACMCYAALQIPGVTLKAAAVTESGGAKATVTYTVGGAWTTSGDFTAFLDAKAFSVPVGATDATTDVAQALVDKINSDARLFATAARVGAVVTVTVANKGPRGNQHIAFIDKTNLPSGATVVLAGGAALTGGMVPFSGGTTADDVTALLAVLLPGTYDYQAWAHNDATNINLIRNQVNTKAGPLEGRLEFFGIAFNGVQSAAISIAQTTLNEQRGEAFHLLNCETHPSRVAAAIMALRSVTEPAQPNSDYDEVEVPGVAPQRFEGDRPGRSALKAALNNSVTPLKTTSGGKVTICRAITTHSLNGASPDYRTLDVAEAVVPDRVRKDLVSFWTTSFRPANPFVGPDPAAEERLPPEGMATPRIWNSEVENYLREHEERPFFWVTDVDNHLPESEWDDAAKRIMTAVPVVVTPHNHQQGISVRQTV